MRIIYFSRLAVFGWLGLAVLAGCGGGGITFDHDSLDVDIGGVTISTPIPYGD